MIERLREKEIRLIPEIKGIKGIRILVVFPDEYSIAISNLGFHDIYANFAQQEFVTVDRAFFVRGEPLTRSFEKDIPVYEFDIIAFSVSYELQYYNVVDFLISNNIPVFSLQRQEHHPFIIAGGPAITSNPEPIADALDAAFIGEAEEKIPEILEAFNAFKTRDERKVALISVEGVYIPEFKNKPVRQHVFPLDNIRSESIFITPNSEFSNTFLIEIARGCIRNCSFCLARNIYAPCRFFSYEHIESRIDRAKDFTDKIGLVSTTVNNHPAFDRILEKIKADRLKVSMSSLDLRSIDAEILIKLKDVGVQTITLAPESGSQKILERINKRITVERIVDIIDTVSELRFPVLKLYFLVGLPGETEDDLHATGQLIKQIKNIYRGNLKISINPFVPKLHTPFFNADIVMPEYFRKAIEIIRNESGKIKIISYNPVLSQIQGIIARGGRELLQIFIEARKGFGLKRAFLRHPLTMRYYMQNCDEFALGNFE